MQFTQQNITDLRELMTAVINDRVPQIVDERIGKLPSREDFFSVMDSISNELQIARQERIILNHKVVQHTNEITLLQDDVEEMKAKLPKKVRWPDE